MKVIVRTRTALLHDSDLTMEMHRLRRRVFKDRLDWDVYVSAYVVPSRSRPRSNASSLSERPCSRTARRGVAPG